MALCFNFLPIMSDTTQTVSGIHFFIPHAASIILYYHYRKRCKRRMLSNKRFLFNKLPPPSTMLTLYYMPPSNKHPLSNRCPHDNYSKILGISKKGQNHCILFNIN